ncbi:MAG: sodium:solute symporter [Flavobacteriales bacterium]|jgi:Na+/proline symporter|nr:sodium:solute symporter [Flavobacteriales bacterium]MBT7480990.1 sodium:solute symporter [Flavobacteriales bacterium]
MTTTVILTTIFSYFLLLILVSFFTGKSDSNDSFFLGDKKSPWYIVAFGMIGASLSGVTFISVPGWVESSQFSYMQMVFGYLAGYLVIATVLMPLYYLLNLTSIYTYLKDRFGNSSYKTAASFFLLSRVIGASFRLYLVANVLQLFVCDSLDIPFWQTVLITILLIWVYTFRSGIKTIIWTDTLQTLFMLLAVGMSVYLISEDMNLSFTSFISTVKDSEYSQIFFWEGKNHFVKQFLAGMFMAIVMTGLDQDMMQKNLSCKNIKEAQKNMLWFSVVLVFVNLLFLSLGALLYIYANKNGIVFDKADDLFPTVVNSGTLGVSVAVIFILGLIAAAYSSADSALTSLTTSFCVDILGFDSSDSRKQVKTRKMVHLGFSLLLFAVILLFKLKNDDSVVSSLFKAAGYTYGPLLGLYAFGMATKWKIKDVYVPIICVLSPFLTYYIADNSLDWFNYEFGFELLILNGAITFIGLDSLREEECNW